MSKVVSQSSFGHWSHLVVKNHQVVMEGYHLVVRSHQMVVVGYHLGVKSSPGFLLVVKIRHLLV